MARDYFINGETMVAVKGHKDSSIAYLTNLGLTDAAGLVRITPNFRHTDIMVDAWGGGEIPAELQYKLADVTITMALIHFDRAILDEVLRLSMAGPSAIGVMPRTGTRMGGGNARFSPGWNYVELDLYSPVGTKPWRFYNCILTGPPMEFPLGTEKSVVPLTFRAIPYTTDPWGSGVGSQGAILWDHVLSTS